MKKTKFHYTKKLYNRFKGTGIFTIEEAVAIFGNELDLESAQIQTQDSLLVLWGVGAVRLHNGGLSRNLSFSTWEIISNDKWEN